MPRPDSVSRASPRSQRSRSGLLAPMTGPHVEHASGRVEIGSGEPPVWRAARDGDALAPGDVVRTGPRRPRRAGARGGQRAALRRLAAAAAGRRGRAAGSADGVELDSGSSLFDVLHRGTRPLRGAHARGGREHQGHALPGRRRASGPRSRSSAAVSACVRDASPRASCWCARASRRSATPGGRSSCSGAAAPDPWDAWFDGGAAAARARAGGRRTPCTRRSASRRRRPRRSAESRREAVEQAIERHPEVAERVEKTIEQQDCEGTSASDDSVPAAPAPTW